MRAIVTRADVEALDLAYKNGTFAIGPFGRYRSPLEYLAFRRFLLEEIARAARPKRRRKRRR